MAGARPPAARTHGSRVPRVHGRDDGAPAPRVPHDERADACRQRHRLRGHGGVLRQPARTGRHRRSSASTACSASACARSPAAAAPRSYRVEEAWGRPLDPQRLLDAHAAASGRPPRRRRPRRDVDRRRERDRAAAPRCRTPTRSCSSTRSRRSAASRSTSTAGASTPATPAPRSASACRPGLSPVTFSERAVERVRSRDGARAVVVPRPRRCSPTTSPARRASTTTPRPSR